MKRAPLVGSLRMGVFGAVEALSEYRTRRNPVGLIVEAPEGRVPDSVSSIWIFVATLGEFNLMADFIGRLQGELPDQRLVLVTNRDLYNAAYRRRFPDAVIAITDGCTRHARELGRRFPPKALLIAEIPCWPADAPCRLHYPLVDMAARSGATVALINAWIYNYPAVSRLERIERTLLRRDYLRSMTLITTQTEEVRDRLVRAGADPAHIYVTGNMKFDVLGRDAPTMRVAPGTTLSELIASPRLCVIAGCVGKVEQQPLISAFRMLREVHASARIVVALRHPENPEHLENLIDLLDDARLSWIRRTEHGDDPLPHDCDCFILDTFGELARFYAAGTVAYVGRDHNVLEPLVHDVPVSVLSGWKSIFPSYPIYQVLRDRGLLSEADDAAELAGIWIRWLGTRSDSVRDGSTTSAELRTLTGATEKNLQLVLDLLDAGGKRRSSQGETIIASVRADA